VQPLNSFHPYGRIKILKKGSPPKKRANSGGRGESVMKALSVFAAGEMSKNSTQMAKAAGERGCGAQSALCDTSDTIFWRCQCHK